MRGIVNIEVYDKKIHYFLTLRRNITIIRGDSGTGKTVLYRMIQESMSKKNDGNVVLKSNAECRVLTDASEWEFAINNRINTVFFIDEDNDFVSSNKFQVLANQNSNYFVIISREPFTNLTYSSNEIYGFRETGKYRNADRVYNEMYNLYTQESFDCLS